MARRRKEDQVGRDEARDEVLVSARAEGKTYEAIGELIGRSARTARRLLAAPEMRSRVAERRYETAANAAARSTALLERAIEVLEELLDDAVPVVRLRAADAALRYHFRFAAEVTVLDDLRDLRDQLEELRSQTREKAEGS
jgi:predicted transcriptional regulator